MTGPIRHRLRVWLAGGEPWVWMNAAAVGLSLGTVLGLVLLLAGRGLGHFWPADVGLYVYLDDQGRERRILGELRGIESLSLRQYRESASLEAALNAGRLAAAEADFSGANADGDSSAVERLLIKKGNRRRDPPDFVRIYRHRILSIAQPEGAAVLERAEWGNAYGEIAALQGVAPGTGEAALWPAFQTRLAQANALRESGAPPSSEVFQLRLGDGRLLEMRLADVLRAWQPNRMGFLEKLGHCFGNLWRFLSEWPREANTEGGIFPAILGTVTMVLLMTLMVAPLGVVAAVYLREYAGQGPLVRLTRIAVNNLAGVPSIVYGAFGLGFFVYVLGKSVDRAFYADALPAPTFGTPGLIWASLTLALLTLPVVIVATEEGLVRIPRSQREGSLALGATKAETLFRVLLPIAFPSVLTGMMLAVARAAGEVAPLMLVGVVKLAPALPIDGEFPFVHLERKFMHLGFHIYDLGFQSPSIEAARPLVYATALLLVAIVLLLNLTAILLRNRLEARLRGL